MKQELTNTETEEKLKKQEVILLKEQEVFYTDTNKRGRKMQELTYTDITKEELKKQDETYTDSTNALQKKSPLLISLNRN